MVASSPYRALFEALTRAVGKAKIAKAEGVTMGELIELPFIDTDMVLDAGMTVNLASNPVMAVVSQQVLEHKELAEEVQDCLVFLLDVTRGRYRIAAVLAACQAVISVVSANILVKIPQSGYQIIKTSEGLKCVTSASS